MVENKYTLAADYILRDFTSHSELISLDFRDYAILNKDATILLKSLIGKLDDIETDYWTSEITSQDIFQKHKCFVDDLISRRVIVKKQHKTPLKNQVVNVKTSLFLRILHLHHTSHCNLQCVFCYSSPVKNMSLQKWQNVIKDALDNLGTYSFAFSGGEPLIDINLLRYLASLNDYVFTSLFFTNCVEITDEMLSYFSSLRKPSFCISLHTVDQIIFERITKTQKEVDVVLRNIVKLRDAGYKIRLGTVFAKGLNDDIDQVKRLFDVVEMIQPDSYTISNVATIGKAAMSNEYKVTSKVFSSISELYVRRFLDPKTAKIQMDPIMGHTCIMGAETCNIMPNGDLTPCVSLQSIKVGSVDEKPLSDLWIEKSNSIKSMRDGIYDECMKCSLFKYCKGGCRGRAYSKTHSLKACDTEARIHAGILNRIALEK